MKHQINKAMFFYRSSKGKILKANFIYTKLPSSQKVFNKSIQYPTFLNSSNRSFVFTN